MEKSPFIVWNNFLDKPKLINPRRSCFTSHLTKTGMGENSSQGIQFRNVILDTWGKHCSVRILMGGVWHRKWPLYHWLKSWKGIKPIETNWCPLRGHRCSFEEQPMKSIMTVLPYILHKNGCLKLVDMSDINFQAHVLFVSPIQLLTYVDLGQDPKCILLDHKTTVGF